MAEALRRWGRSKRLGGNVYFGSEFFEFLGELRENNNRDWFQANKGRFEAKVRDPLVRFVEDFADPLRGISRHFVADPRPVGGSIFRIYRDMRFSKDKSPYKTQAALHFRHEVGREVHGPGFYLHLEPGNVFAGVGVWHPDSEALGKIRGAMAENPDRWRRIVGGEEFGARYKLEGESLKRPPAGYEPDHPLIEDLKRKDFIASTYFSEEDAYSSEFLRRYAESCKAASPLMEFLTTVVGLPW